MNKTEIATRLRCLARRARLEAETGLAREIDQLADELMGARPTGRDNAPPARAETINGRRVMVQRPRGSFAV